MLTIFDYIEVFYNQEKTHSADDYLSLVYYKIQQENTQFMSGKVLTHHLPVDISPLNNVKVEFSIDEG